MAPRRRFGAFVYTVATRVTIRIATRAAPGGTSASTTMACRRRLLAGPSRLGGKTGSARVALPLAASSPRRQPTRTHEASRKTAICTRRIARGKLLPLYHARDRVEKVFEIAKQGGKALPVCVRSEETLGGHLLMCLVATAATRMMPDVPASRRTSPAVESMPGIPRERHATGRDGRLAATEPVRKTSEAHGAFGIRCPDTIRLPVVSQGSAGNSGLLRAGREPWRPQQRSARHSRAGPHQEGVHLHRPAREKLTSGEGVAGQAVPAVL